MTKEDKVKRKYKVGQEVYTRPHKSATQGFRVYKCIVKESPGVISGTDPYYTLEIVTGGEGELHRIMEEEMSKRPEKLVADAHDAIDLEFGGYIETRNKLVDELDCIFPDRERSKLMCHVVTDNEQGVHGVYENRERAEIRKKEVQFDLEMQGSNGRVSITSTVIN
jgi:hypothetical protein